jgi:hypothetical protein
MGTLLEDQCTHVYGYISVKFSSKLRVVTDNFDEKIKPHILYSVFFFRKSCHAHLCVLLLFRYNNRCLNASQCYVHMYSARHAMFRFFAV